MEDLSKERELLEKIDLHNKEKIYEDLVQCCTDHRRQLFDSIIENRTRHITIVLENIFQSQNASAALRTSEILGIQDIHIIENEHEYTLNPDVALGASKWLNCKKYNASENNTKGCIDKLKNDGYIIAATLPNEKCVSIENLDISKKIALVFGSEKTGLSDIAIQEADISVKIPMFGFTESYNISVSVAICLYELTQRLRKSDVDWKLSEDEKLLEKILWAKRSINRSDLLFNKTIQNICNMNL